MRISGALRKVIPGKLGHKFCSSVAHFVSDSDPCGVIRVYILILLVAVPACTFDSSNPPTVCGRGSFPFSFSWRIRG